jgi:hypothetical protein
VPIVDLVNLRESIDELDVLIAEMTELRQQLCVAELDGDRERAEQALWATEVGLGDLARRAGRRARIVHRAIELMAWERSASTFVRHG